jgi:peptidyl-tRNA hydrolase
VPDGFVRLKNLIINDFDVWQAGGNSLKDFRRHLKSQPFQKIRLVIGIEDSRPGVN